MLYDAEIYDTLDYEEDTTNKQPLNILDTLDTYSSTNWVQISNISDSLIGSEALNINVVINLLLNEDITLLDSISYVSSVIAQDLVDITEEIDTISNKIFDISDILSLVSEPSAKLTIAKSIAETVVLADVLKWYANCSVEDMAEIADLLYSEIVQRFNIQDSLEITENPQVSLVVLTPDTLEVSETLNLRNIINILASDGIIVIGPIDVDGVEYQAWVMNTDTTGVTRYSNYSYNSLVSYNNSIYALNEAGLYKQEGTTDNGTAIPASVKTGELDWGTSANKNCPRAYIYTDSDGELLLRVYSIRRGNIKITDYTIPIKSGETTLRSKRLGGGIKGTWWQFELQNVNGSDFKMDGGEVYVELRNRSG